MKKLQTIAGSLHKRTTNTHIYLVLCSQAAATDDLASHALDVVLETLAGPGLHRRPGLAQRRGKR